MSDLSDLIEFLRARLDEDEAMARAALGDDEAWRLDRSGGRVLSESMHGAFGQWIAQPDGDEMIAEHIARWSPARVLAETAARRAVLNLYLETRDGDLDTWSVGRLYGLETAVEAIAQRLYGLEAAVEAIAQPYADHPDFDPCWRLADGPPDDED